jgi:uncharacterized membrane protein YphA (DoxX/SURF4 family)
MSPERGTTPWLRWGAGVGRWIVGGIFLFAGGIKALDPQGFARQIDAYGWVPAALLHPAALLLITVEVLLGAALLVGPRPGIAAWGTGVLLLLFIGVSGEAWWSGRQIECGCFGGALERTPAQVVLEDLLMLAALVPTFWAPGRPVRARWRRVVPVGTAAAVLAVAIAAPGLPLDGLVTGLKPGRDVAALGLDTLVPEQGAVLMALLELGQEPSRAAVPALNDVAVEIPECQVLGLAAAGPEERALFGWTEGAGFPVDEVGASTVDSLARALPRFALLVDGRVVAVWNETPPRPEALRSVMGGMAS